MNSEIPDKTACISYVSQNGMYVFASRAVTITAAVRLPFVPCALGRPKYGAMNIAHDCSSLSLPVRPASRIPFRSFESYEEESSISGGSH